jgi:3-dehydroquinate synthase
MQSIQVSLGQRSYRIFIGTPGAQDLAVALRQNCPDASKMILVADQNVLPMALRIREAFAVSTSDAVIIEVPSGEGSKSVKTLEKLWQQMAFLKADRKAIVVALGGGVVGDLAGFLAASWNRGIRLVQIPTTLLAMVDSSVGGKTGINLPEAKNVIGAFWQPSMVWIDLRSLDSLPEREYRSGLAEVVKYGVILDSNPTPIRSLQEKPKHSNPWSSVVASSKPKLSRTMSTRRRDYVQSSTTDTPLDTPLRLLQNTEPICMAKRSRSA